MKRIICFGGGELKSKTTLKIDEYVANLAKAKSGDKRAYGLFVGTASHDSMPYFNSFRKTYTSVFDIKADCALTVYGEMNIEKIKDKFQKADFVYIGGGDTLFMIEHWKKSGLYDLIIDAYNRGVIMVGLSAGAIFWFKTMYTDSAQLQIDGDPYNMHPGIGVLDGCCTPHYNHRIEDFNYTFKNSSLNFAYAIEDDCAIEFVDGKLTGSISAGGKAYLLKNNSGCIESEEIKSILQN